MKNDPNKPAARSHFAAFIKMLRRKFYHGSLEDCAANFNVTPQTWAEWESGGPVPLAYVSRISEILHEKLNDKNQPLSAEEMDLFFCFFAAVDETIEEQEVLIPARPRKPKPDKRYRLITYDRKADGPRRRRAGRNGLRVWRDRREGGKW